jgi:Nuclease-related domain/PhoH-like protein
MARMIPEAPLDTGSTAERRLFDRLRDDTPDEVVAFHSVAWQLLDDKGRPEQGESDFVLAHPEFGVITLEVKGGSIRYDAKAGKWFTTGKAGETQLRKDPARQAQSSSHLLRRTLARATRDGGKEISFGHGVAFPDCRMDRRALRTDLPRELVLDHSDVSRLRERLERLFVHWFDRDRKARLGTEGIELLERVLANSFELRAPLAYELAEEERELLHLTEGQYRVLDMLSRQTRVAIAGCAGSGKTFLAAEKARRLAAQGFRVLVVVFNVLLGEHLRRVLADEPNITVRMLHGLFREVAEAAGLELPSEPEPGDNGRYYRKLETAFAENAEVMAGRFDALIVDEGQDVSADWWLPLQILLTDPDESPLYVFFDDNQKLFPVPTGLPFLEAPFLLTENCRNTQRINELVAKPYSGGTIHALGPEGIPVDRHVYETERELLGQLDEAVARWIGEAEVAPEDIALLTAKSAGRSALWKVDTLGGIRLTDDPWERNRILRCSLFRCKGLERLVCGLCELDGAREQAPYVGISRPSVFLSIFVPRSAASRIPA